MIAPGCFKAMLWREIEQTEPRTLRKGCDEKSNKMAIITSCEVKKHKIGAILNWREAKWEVVHIAVRLPERKPKRLRGEKLLFHIFKSTIHIV
jgi:hypothetical protein